MIDDSNKSSPQNQDVNELSTEKVIDTSLTPRTFEGKEYYGASDVAKIIGVGRTTVLFWHQKGLFTADKRTHDGIYLYEIERVMQLKSVYHKKWTRGGYEAMPDFKSQWLPYATDSDVEAVKRLSRFATDDLKDKINSYDPHFIFEEAGSSRNPDKRKIICPICGNGKGRDATPVEVEFKGDRWLYHCFRECGFQGDLLKII